MSVTATGPPSSTAPASGQRAQFGNRTIATTFTVQPDFAAIARACQCHGEKVDDPGEIRPALERARESGKPSLINVWVDPDAYAPGTMNQTMYK